MSANDLEPNTYIPVSDQIERVRSSIEDPYVLHLYEKAVAPLDVAANDDLIRRYGSTVGLSNPLKYIDCAYWIFHKLQFALHLGLDKGPRKRILDIGIGGGHFCHVCRILGHDAVGIDLDVAMYQDICKLLSIKPINFAIQLGVPLPELGGRFDMITAFAAQFDSHKSGKLWTKVEWRFFLEDLLRHNIRTRGRIFFTLNSIADPDTGQQRFKHYVAEVFEDLGGRGEPGNTSVELDVTEALISSFPGRASWEATEEASFIARDPLLIFDDPMVPICSFRHPLLTKQFWDDMKKASDTVKILGTFPTPGDPPPSEVARISFNGDHVIFPHPGEYYFYCDIGIFKTLILGKNSTFQERVLQIFSFISRNIVHSQIDTWLFLREGEASPFYWQKLDEKFFFSDQPLSMYCGNATNFLAAVLHRFGIQTRAVSFGGGKLGHIVLEFRDEANGVWIMLDADFGVVVTDSFGNLLSTDSFVSHIREWSGVAVIDLARKNWCKNEFDVSRRFAGVLSWTPEWQMEARAGDATDYLRSLRDCIGTLSYEAFIFDDAQGIVSWAPWSEA